MKLTRRGPRSTSLGMVLVVLAGCTAPPTLEPLPPADIGAATDAGATRDTGGDGQDVGRADLGRTGDPDGEVGPQRPDQGTCAGASARDEIGKGCQGPEDCPCYGQCLPQRVCGGPVAT